MAQEERPSRPVQLLWITEIQQLADMGVDCLDVHEVIHFGVPNDAQTYIQVT